MMVGVGVIFIVIIVIIVPIIITLLILNHPNRLKDAFADTPPDNLEDDLILSEKLINDPHAWFHAKIPFKEINIDLSQKIKNAYRFSRGKDPDGDSIDKIFAIDTIFPCRRKTSNVVVFSLFAKSSKEIFHNNNFVYEPPGKFYDEVTDTFWSITEENLKLINKNKKGSIWSIYIEPLIKQLKHIQSTQSSYKARIYLAQDLKFLIPKLHNQSTEIYLMKHSSKATSGTLWRFLTIDDKTLNTVILNDADMEPDSLVEKLNLFKLEANIKKKPGIGILRYLNDKELLCSPWNDYYRKHYLKNNIFLRYFSPFQAGYLIIRPKFINKNVKTLMKNFIAFNIPPIGSRKNFKYPYYGIDESFLANVLYYVFIKEVYTLYKPLYPNCMHDEKYKKTIDVKDYHMNPDNWIEDNL